MARPAPALIRLVLPLVLGCVLAPCRANAQGCSRLPFAAAGEDVTLCIPPTGFTDFPLSGFGSISRLENGPITTYCWRTDFGTFLESGTETSCLPTPDVTLRAPHVYGHTVIAVSLTVTDASGCSDSDDLVLDLATAPVITRAQIGATPTCFGTPVSVYASGVNTFGVSGLIEYRWDFDASLDANLDGDPGNDPDAVVVAVSGHVGVASFTPDRIGSFVARLTAVVEGNRCLAQADVPYAVEQPPGVRLVVGPATMCQNESGAFQAELAFGDAGSDLTWDFDISVDSDGDGNPANDVEGSGYRVFHAWPEPGIYTLRATAVSTADCRGWEDRTLLIKAAPVPAFTTSGPGCGAAIVSFIDRSTGVAPLAVSWDYGDGSPIESGLVRSHLFPGPGSYVVTHFVTDDDGCIMAESRRIDVFPATAEIVGVTVLDGQPGTGTTGDANGFADPGESIRLALDVRNASGEAVDALTAALTSRDTTGFVTVTDSDAAVPPLAPGQTRTTLAPHLGLQVASFAPCGDRVPLEIRVAAPGGACPATLLFPLPIGAPGVTRSGPELAATSSPGRADRPDIVFGAGVHVVAVSDATGPRSQVRLVRFDSAGHRVGEDVVASDPAVPSGAPQVAWAGDVARFAVAYTTVESGGAGMGSTAARLRLLDAGTSPIGVARRLDRTGSVTDVDVAWAGDHWMAAWIERPASGSSRQLFVQAVTADGQLLGSPAAVGGTLSTSGTVRLASDGSRVLAASADGSTLRLHLIQGFSPASVVASWTLDNGGRAAVDVLGGGFLAAFESGSGIDVAWIPAEGELQRSRVTDSGSRPALALGGELDVVAWESGADIVASVVSATGRAVGEAVLVTPGTGLASRPALAASSDGFCLAAWESLGEGGNTLVRAVVLGPSAPAGCSHAGAPGDVAPAPDGNGIVDIGDVVLVLRAAVGLEPVTAEMLARGDVAPGVRTGSEHRIVGDGLIDIGDAVVLLQASVGLVTLVP